MNPPATRLFFRGPAVVPLLQRVKVVGPCIFLAVMGTGLFCFTELPSGLKYSDRLELWGMMLSGPFAVIWFQLKVGDWGIQLRVGDWGIGPLSALVSGFLAPLLIAAHPYKPAWWTALLSILGIGSWLFAGFIIVMILL